MALINPTVDELRRYLATVPGHYEIYIQANTEHYPNATPEPFAVELWEEPESVPSMVLLAGVTLRGGEDE